MKKMMLGLVVFCTALTPAMSQTGVYIEMKTTSDGKGPGGAVSTSGIMKLYHDTPGSRMEMTSTTNSGKSYTMVSLRQSSRPDINITLNEMNKTYSEITMAKNVSNSDTGKVTVKVIGSETVNGYACKHIQVTDTWGTTDEWLTTSITMDESYQMIFAKEASYSSSAHAKAMKDAGVSGFPVRISKKGDHGTTTMDLVKYEKKTLDASLFNIPDGYTKTETPGGFGLPGGKSPSEMTPEERQKFLEELKKQMEKQKAGGGN